MTQEIYDTNNIFAKILKGEVFCEKIYEDSFVLAFNDVNPQALHHVLIIPKGAYMNLKDFSEKALDKEVVAFYKAIGKIADKLGVTDKGFRVVSNHGKDGGQEVSHFHIHFLAGEQLGKKLV